MFPVKILVAFKIKMGSTTDHMHPPTPTTVQVLPLQTAQSILPYSLFYYYYTIQSCKNPSNSLTGGS